MSHEQSEKKNPQGSTASNPSDKPAGAAPEQDGAVESGNATPPVDQALLQGLLRKELPEARAREVYRWIYTDPAWDDAHNRLLLERLRASQSAGDEAK